MRKNYEMTEEQLKELFEAARAVPLIALQCGMPASRQSNANDAWEKLGKEMGFDYMTVRPTGQGDRFFSAESNQCKGANCSAINGINHSAECIADHENIYKDIN